MEGKYSFERMENELDNGYIIFYTYVRNRYQLFKTSENCYTQQLLTENLKNPLPRLTIITHKRLKEIYPYMENILEHVVLILELDYFVCYVNNKLRIHYYRNS